MIQYLIAAGIGAILGKNARKKKYARGGKVDQATRSSFRYHLDSAGKHLDEADTILSRKGDHQGAYGHLIAAHLDGMGMRNMVRRREGNFYESTPAMKGLLDQYEDVITDLIIHVEDVKDIDGYNPDKALRRIGAAQRILASVEGEHENKGQRKMARGGRLDEEDIKDELYNMGVDYDDLMENAGMDLNDIQDQYLGYQFDPVTATWSRGYAKGGQTSESAHHEMDALKKGDTIRIIRLTDNRRTETPILLTLVRKGRVNKGKRNEQTKFKFENEDGQTFFAYKSDGDEPRFAFGDMGIIVSDDIDFSPKMAHGGTMQGYDAFDYLYDYATFRQASPFDTDNAFAVKIVDDESGKRNTETIWAESEESIREDLVKIMTDSQAIEGIVKVDPYGGRRLERGGNTQGYNDKLDESLGSRRGSGRTKEQGRKDRRDESEAMERSMGRRKYAAVGSMDKGDRMMAEGGQIPIPKEVLSGKEYIALALDEDGKPHMKFSKTFNGALRMAKNLDKKFDTGYAVQKYDPFLGNWFLEQNIFIPSSKQFREGGKTKRKEVSSFDKLAMKVAARYRAEGKSNKEALEIGRGTAAKVYRQQQAKKGKK